MSAYRALVAALFGAERRATHRVQQLLTVPQSERGPDWGLEFGGQLPRAAFQRIDDAPVPGPHGFLCWRLSVAGAGGERWRFDVALDHALNDGVGLEIIAPAGGTDVEVRFGELATYRMFGTWRTPPGWNGGMVDNGQEILTQEESIEVAAPNEEYLPPFIRQALRNHLESAGLPGVKVLLVLWPERDDHRDLAFSIERDRCSSQEAYDDLTKSVAWFLPDGYQYLDWDCVSQEMRSPAVPL